MSTPQLPERKDDRRLPPMTVEPRQQLGEWLDWYRETVLLKVAGLSARELSARSVPPSKLTLVGIVRHLTEVEAYWVREVLEGDASLPDYYSTEEDRDGDFNGASADTAIADVERYEREIAITRGILATWIDLDATAYGKRRGQPLNVSWVLIHLVEEYARHVGHMDLLRESIDGRTGD